MSKIQFISAEYKPNQLTIIIKPMVCFTVGLKYDTINKKLDDEVYREGLHPGPPGYEMIVFPSIYTTNSLDDATVRMICAMFSFDCKFEFYTQAVPGYISFCQE